MSAVATAVASAVPSATSADDLLTYLAPIAARVRTLGFRYVVLRTKTTGDYLRHAEVEHLSLTAALDAFVSLGGDPEHPAAFDWTARTNELEHAALLSWRRELTGRRTEFGDMVKRLTGRRAVTPVEALRWTAWNTTGGLDGETKIKSGARAARAHATEVLGQQEQDEHMLFDQLKGFDAALAEVCDAQTYRWIVERFRDGVTQTAQIDAFIAERPEYQGGPDGRKRAEDYINQRVSRGRKRAAKLLAPKWAALAKEVVSD